MTFPQTLLGTNVDFKPDGGAWTTFSADVLARDSISITRGRRDEQATVDATQVAFTIDNRLGSYSPRNPNSAYFGIIGRNTPCRGWIPGTLAGLDVPAKDGSFVVNWLNNSQAYYGVLADAAPLRITGDIDLRADIYLYDWNSSVPGVISQRIIQKRTVLNDLSYMLAMDQVGGQPRLRILWSPDGTDAATLGMNATVPLPQPWFGRKAVRATLQVNNGAGSRVATFYTATTLAGPWTQLGDVVTTAGTTSIYSGTQQVRLGRFCLGTLYGIEIRSGINGTVVASGDFTAQADGTTTFSDAQGNAYSLVGPCQITKKDPRWYTEMSSWPQKWDTTGKAVYVPMTSSGIIRRLGTAPALRSAYVRGVTSLYSQGSAAVLPTAYWPMEEGSLSKQFVAYNPTNTNLPSPLRIISGQPNIGSSNVFVAALQSPTIENSVMLGNVPGAAQTTAWSVAFLLQMPTTPLTGPITILRIRCGGSAPTWDIIYTNSTTITIQPYDNLGNALTSGSNTWTWNGVPYQMQLSASTSAGNTSWTIIGYQINNLVQGLGSGTLTGYTVSNVTQVIVNPNASTMTGVSFGHLSTWTSSLAANQLQIVASAYAGETAGARITRLCDEENISCVIKGYSDGTSKMGPQRVDTLINILREAESTDHGILYEPREFFGLAYRTRSSMAAQPTGLTLTYSAADTSIILPQDDDQLTRNDVTAQRPNGGSVRKYTSIGVFAITGRIGDYTTSPSVNCQQDGGLTDHATWLLHVGTVDESRYPQIGIEMARQNFSAVGNSAKYNAAAALDIGDLLVVTGVAQIGLPPDDIRQIVQGYNETMPTQFMRAITWNCAPASPYDVAVYNDGVSRYSSQASSLAAGITAIATSFTVNTTSGARWITTAESAGSFPFDIMIGGERMTVTNIAGTTTAQTFTVTRNVNGLSPAKTHNANDAVTLFRPYYYGLQE